MNEDDVKAMEKFLKEPWMASSRKSECTKYCNASSVWQWTNEEIGSYYEKNLENKKVLTITAGGDHILHSVLGGCKDVTAFDINVFSKYFANLKIQMIKSYDYDTFWNKSEILTQDGFKDINKLDDAIKNLSWIEQMFFERIERKYYEYRYNEIFTERLGIHLLNEFDVGRRLKYAYSNPDNYKKLQSQLDDCDIKYTDYMVEELTDNLSGKYDVIYLSNVLSVMDNLKDAILVLNDLEQILKPGGIIYDYAFDDEYGFNFRLKSSGMDYVDVLRRYDVTKEDCYLDTKYPYGVIYKYKNRVK